MATSGSTEVVATRASNGETATTLRFEWNQESQSIPNNNTTIAWRMILISHRYGAISSSASKTWYVVVNGTAYGTTNTVGIGANTSKTLASGRTTIGHNSDGTKSFSYKFRQRFDITFNGFVGVVEGNGSATLNTIPRYANFTAHSLSSRTQTSAIIRWSANATCKRVRYQIGSGSWVQISTASASSGTYTVSNLAPNTSYSIKTEIQRSDSSLTTTSGAITVTTLPIATMTSGANFNIGSNITIAISNSSNNASVIYLDAQNDVGTWERIASTTSPQGTSSYTWNLSSVTSTLYSKCAKRNQMNVRIGCGVTLNGTWYSHIKTGVAKVINSNPTFSNFTFLNTDTAINTLLGTTDVFAQSRGNCRIVVSSANKAVAKNGAWITKYVASVTNNQTLSLKEPSYVEGDLNIDMGGFAVNGTLNVNVYAIDSRGNKTNTVTKSFVVLPYHNPIVKTTLKRANGFEKEISLNFSVTYSRLMIGSVQKNSLTATSYTIKEDGSSTETDPETINGLTFGQSPTDEIASVNIPYLMDLDINKAFDFKFTVADSLNTVIVSSSLPQGIPIMAEFDDGHVSVGMIPDFASGAKLQVGSDIVATDSNGNTTELLKAINDLRNELGSSSALVKNIFLRMHPVGHIMLTTSSTNPQSIWGGTWQAWGTGRVPVGIDTSQTEFNTLQKTGGSKTHTLTEAQIPSHSHSLNDMISYVGNQSGASKYTVGYGGSEFRNLYTNSKGGGQAHNNLQPYITCYMWRRTS